MRWMRRAAGMHPASGETGKVSTHENHIHAAAQIVYLFGFADLESTAPRMAMRGEAFEVWLVRSKNIRVTCFLPCNNDSHSLDATSGIA